MADNSVELELKEYRDAYTKLELWTIELQKGKDFLEEENKKMRIWCAELETDKKELAEQLSQQKHKVEDLEILVTELNNEKSKINYKLNHVLEDAKVKKIVESKHLLEL